MILLRYLFVCLCCLMISRDYIYTDVQIFMYQLVRNQYPSTEKRLLDDVLGMCMSFSIKHFMIHASLF